MLKRILLLPALVLAVATAQAQTWPQKPVRMVVAFPPGGSTDIAVRVLAERIAPALGQNVVVENRTGASGNVAAEYVVRQPADGHLVLATADALASTPHLYKLAFEPAKDFVPVVQLTRQPVVLAAHPSLGVSSVAELISLAKSKPGLAYATSGAGSLQHIAGEWFAKLAGVSLTHVPYKGGGQAVTDLVGGQVPLGSLGNTPLLPHYRAGKLKILAQTTRARSASLPNVPTYEEAGQKGLVLEQWLGLFVIAGSPPEAVARLNAEIGRALGEAAVRERFAQYGLEPVGGTPEQFARVYRADYAMYARLIKDLNIRLN
ncbi:MAG: tripartite tricarboxylate transporter substrate binding protein [Betaproteobacteria bacterium]|nr:tripartite tricarboxylate transporter substrate binding protein [Betaproteobacteria bacterium]